MYNCAQAGSTVHLFDTNAQAAVASRDFIQAQWTRILRNSAWVPMTQSMNRLEIAATLQALAGCDLIVRHGTAESRQVFQRAEAIVSPRRYWLLSHHRPSPRLAGMKHPQRIVGFHFFNPVPLMVVEVIAGLRTDPAVVQPCANTASGSQACRCPTAPALSSTVGGATPRPCALSEGVADFATIDRTA